jgi:hypothetical protein
LIYFGFLGVNLLCSGFNEDIIFVASLAAVSIPPIMLALFFASCKSRKAFNATRFIMFFGITLFSFMPISFATIWPFPDPIVELLMASFLSGLIYFAATLPFLVLLYANPFWRNRFEAVSGIKIGGKEIDFGNANN